MPLSYWLDILGILLCGIILAAISLLESALVSISPLRLRQLSDEGHPTAPLAARLVERRQELLGGFIIIINALVLLSANLTTTLARHYGSAETVVWANGLVLLALLLFAEVTPKTLGVYLAERIALRGARLVYAMTRLLSPLVLVLNGIGFALLHTLTFLHLLPGRVHAAPTSFSEEDIKELVSAGEQSGEVEEMEREMIHGVIEFAETAAREIMVPRTDLVSLEVNTPLAEAITTLLDSGHSRIPVYEEHIDDILGLLYIKDLLIHLHASRLDGHAEPRLRDLLRPAYFVPETKKSDDLLREMQRKQVHMAVVVDEYGGTAGIITIEDLLEEIVGDIIDEYDQEELEVTWQPDGSALISGRASLDTLQETFEMNIPEETDAETISGLITEQLGRIPVVGDHVVISGIEFTVTDVQHNRIERLQARQENNTEF